MNDKMRLDEIIMTVILESDRDMITGESQLHKTIYILNEKIGLGLDFVTYYYGPHNIEISKVLCDLKSTGIITECFINVPFYSVKDWIESRRSVYLLTEIGIKITKFLRNKYPDIMGMIKYQLSNIEKIDRVYNYENLLIATKIHQLYKIKNEKISLNEIIEDLECLKWKVNYPERIINFLKEIELYNNW